MAQDAAAPAGGAAQPRPGQPLKGPLVDQPLTPEQAEDVDDSEREESAARALQEPRRQRDPARGPFDPLAPGERQHAAGVGPDGVRPAPRDGDLITPAEAQEPVDGIVDAPEAQPPAPLDGVDALLADTRSMAERANFGLPPSELPPADLDPLLFQIEDLEPIADRRIRRLSLLEPFDPVGIRVGSFVLFPTADLDFGAISNVFRAGNGRGDAIFEARPSARLVSNWNVHALEFDASSLLSEYTRFTTENDRAYRFAGRGRLDILRTTNLQAEVSHGVIQESRSVVTAAPASARIDVTTDRAALSLENRFNRLSLQLRGAVTENDYGAVTTTTGGITGSDRTYRSTDEAVRVRYELKPTLAPFVEWSGNQREYRVGAVSDALLRSSNGVAGRAGVAFGQTSAILRGEVSLGYGVQNPNDRRLPGLSAVLVDANLAWRFSAVSSLLLTARTEFGESNLTGSGGALVYTGGAELRHAFRSWLIASAGVTITDTAYSGTPETVSDVGETLGLEYFLNREIVVFGRYQHLDSASSSTALASSYSDDELRVGVRLRR